MADLIRNGGAAFVPPDLLNDSSTPDANLDYFDVVITGLIPDTDYAMQFAWVYEDKTLSPYSSSLDLHTNPITIPEVTNISTSWSNNDLTITWNRPEETVNGSVIGLADSYILSLTYGNTTQKIPFNGDPKQTLQKYILTQDKARGWFKPNFPDQYTGLLQVVNSDGTSTGTTFTTASLSDGITGQNISDSSWALTKVLDGYIVSWAQFTDTGTRAIYDYTEVWQSTAETGTYVLVASGQSPLPIVYYSDLSTKYVKIRHRTKRGTYSNYSNVKQIKAADPSGYRDTGPTNNGTLRLDTPEVDDNGLFDFNYKFKISWDAENDPSIPVVGYRIRWRVKDSGDPYTYTLVPGQNTSSTYLYGVVANTTYEIGKNTIDEYGNTTSEWKTDYITTGAFNGEIKDAKYIKAGWMKLGFGITGNGGPEDVSPGSNKGLYLGPSNYWYVTGNSIESSGAYIKVGSSTSNLIFNGTDLTVTGKINATAGNFIGSISVGGIDSSGSSISGQLRVIQQWDTTVSPAVPKTGIEIGQLNTTYVNVPGVTLSSGIYAYNKQSSKYVLINAADGSIRANNAYIDGTITSSGPVGSWTSNALTISGGKISADNVILLEAPNVEVFGDDFIVNGGNLQVTGNAKIDTNLRVVGMAWDETVASAWSTYKVVGASKDGSLNSWFGVMTSGAYGVSAPPGTIGSDGDFLFST